VRHAAAVMDQMMVIQLMNGASVSGCPQQDQLGVMPLCKPLARFAIQRDG
jgi:hypothetical protein